MNKYEYFLLVAEELSFSKAAARAFVSQQCISTNIRKLEEEFGVLLFNRKPILSLTVAGELLLRRARQMENIQNSINEELGAIKNNDTGTVDIGISYGRAASFMIHVIPKFSRLFPKVKVNMHFGITRDMTRLMEDNKLDLFVGIKTGEAGDPDLCSSLLTYEGVNLAVTEAMLREYFPDEYPECKLRFRHMLDLKEFEKMPFILNSEQNLIMGIVKDYLEKKDVHIEPIIKVEANEIQLVLLDQGACFAFQTLSSYIRIINATRPKDNQVVVFQIPELHNCCSLNLFWRRDVYMPNYISVLKELIVQHYSSPQRDVTAEYLLAAPKFVPEVKPGES